MNIRLNNIKAEIESLNQYLNDKMVHIRGIRGVILSDTPDRVRKNYDALAGQFESVKSELTKMTTMVQQNIEGLRESMTLLEQMQTEYDILLFVINSIKIGTLEDTTRRFVASNAPENMDWVVRRVLKEDENVKLYNIKVKIERLNQYLNDKMVHIRGIRGVILSDTPDRVRKNYDALAGQIESLKSEITEMTTMVQQNIEGLRESMTLLEQMQTEYDILFVEINNIKIGTLEDTTRRFVASNAPENMDWVVRRVLNKDYTEPYIEPYIEPAAQGKGKKHKSKKMRKTKKMRKNTRK